MVKLDKVSTQVSITLTITEAEAVALHRLAGFSYEDVAAALSPLTMDFQLDRSTGEAFAGLLAGLKTQLGAELSKLARARGEILPSRGEMVDKVLIPRAQGAVGVLPDGPDGPGVAWQPIGKEGVAVRCPQGHWSTLRRPMGMARADGRRGHAIADDGSVTSSIVCPIQGCTWHVFGTLDGWAER